MQTKQQRKCIACREIKHQKEMLRIAKLNNEFIVDKLNNLGGRGAYICKCSQCLSQTINKRLLNRAFKTNINSLIYEDLGAYEQNN